MVAILESPAIRQRVQPVSVNEYERMGERINGYRTELIRGVILQKMTASPLHIFLVSRLRRLISALIRTELYCREEKPLKMLDSMPEPDLAVVNGQEEDYLTDYPADALLVIEVSISSLDLDREEAALYAEACVPEHWIILGEQQAVEVYTVPQDGHYTQRRRYARTEMLAASVLPDLAVDLTTLFPAA